MSAPVKPKRCLECGEQFMPASGIQTRHPACQRSFAISSATDRMRDKATWVRSLKIGKSCVDCGWICTEDNYPAFDWDHRPGVTKKFGICKAARHGRAEILDEVAKCDLRCRNCHALVTHRRLRERKSMKDEDWAGRGFTRRNEESAPEVRDEDDQ